MERIYTLSTARSSKASSWKRRSFTWDALVERFCEVRRTEETCAEFDAAPKRERDAIKDGPAFVAGSLKDGRRRKGCVEARSCVILDADASDAELMGDWRMLVGDAAILYPTHSSRPGALKHRLVIPLARDVSADEYVPLAMKLAETLGLARFDATTYQPERLMYFPSASADAEASVEVCQGGPLDPDEWLATYEDWRDASSWPVQPKGVERHAEKAPDPRNKRGAVGAFCRAYPVEAAIEEFLGEVYAPAGRERRYTYLGGTSVAGVACYSGLWAYSNHATDPAGGKLANAFDLVRVHRYGDLDEDSPEDAPVTALPSYSAMCEWAAGLDPVAVELARGAAEAAAEDFADDAEDEGAADDAWKAKLATNAKTGALEQSAGNIALIFENDRGLAGKLWRDVESRAIWARGKRLPWRPIEKGADLWSDEDDAQLRPYLEIRYGFTAKAKIDDAVSCEADKRSYDPLREKLEALPEWDGIERLDTLLVDTLGAEDCVYTRQVTRKTLAGAVARALEPGCKWDFMLILEGAQGLGKSSLWELLAGEEFFTDSLTLRDVESPKVAGEKIRGKWIVEVAELDGMAKASIERLKGWLTTKADNYRAAYARRAAVYKRRCIVVGTVNNLDGYLRDPTGSRRFWPVEAASALNHALLTPDYIAQVWAEARAAYEAGEKLYLEGAAEKQAKVQQRTAMETAPREADVRRYREAPVPPDFDSWSEEDREAFWEAESEPREGWEPRTQITIMEIWHEGLKQPRYKPERPDSFKIKAILSRLGWGPTGRTKSLRAYGKAKAYQPETDA